MANIAVNSSPVHVTVTRTLVNKPATSTLAAIVQYRPRSLVAANPNTTRVDPVVRLAVRHVLLTTCFTPGIPSGNLESIPTGFTNGAIAGVPYIAITSPDGSITYTKVFGYGGLRERLSTNWQVPVGVTQVKIQIGSGGSKAQPGHVMSLSQPKLEFDPQTDPYNGPSGYVPGRPS